MEQEAKKLHNLYFDINKIRPKKEKLYNFIKKEEAKRTQYEQEQSAKIAGLHVSAEY